MAAILQGVHLHLVQRLDKAGCRSRRRHPILFSEHQVYRRPDVLRRRQAAAVFVAGIEIREQDVFQGTFQQAHIAVHDMDAGNGVAAQLRAPGVGIEHDHVDRAVMVRARRRQQGFGHRHGRGCAQQHEPADPALRPARRFQGDERPHAVAHQRGVFKFQGPDYLKQPGCVRFD